MSVWNDKTNNEITMFPRYVEHDKIQSSLSVASIVGDKNQGPSSMGLITQPIVDDSVEDVVQSVTELCIAEESGKEPAAKAKANSFDELGKIIKVSNTKVNFCDVTAHNTVQNKVVDVNEDRLNLERFKECLNRYEAVSLAQKALDSEIIDAFEVYNKIEADGKQKNITTTEATVHACEAKKGFANATKHYWPNNKTT